MNSCGHSDALPDWLAWQFNGQELEELSREAFRVMTLDEDGWPHLAQLSIGEILALDRTRILFLLWPGSATSANLARDGRMVLEAVGRGAVWEIRLHARLSAEALTDLDLKAFAARVISVQEHRASYASILQGLRFELDAPERTHARWRQQIDSLKRLAND